MGRKALGKRREGVEEDEYEVRKALMKRIEGVEEDKWEGRH